MGLIPGNVPERAVWERQLGTGQVIKRPVLEFDWIYVVVLV